MRAKAIILLVAFCALLISPFVIHAWDGNLFSGLPIPDFNDTAAAGNGDAGDAQYGDAAAAQYDAGAASAQYANCPQPAPSGQGLSAAQEEYAQSLPLPDISAESIAKPISLDDMRNHMNVLKQEGRSTKQCLACHTNREEFCDRCHSYSGVSPKFD
ncbi:MAG: hypothetical protein C4534_08745 [Gaiellales bacterium]|nr:MAG: hypothetical protein C4534_08745 [Gaiellales bacterium]